MPSEKYKGVKDTTAAVVEPIQNGRQSGTKIRKKFRGKNDCFDEIWVAY